MRKKRYLQDNVEPQEILLDSLAQKKEFEMGISQKRFEVPLSKSVAILFYVIFLIFIGVFAFQAYDLQVIQGESFLSASMKNKNFDYPIRSARGVIYDRSGKQLVFNEPSFDLIYDKHDISISLDENEKTLSEISAILGLNINTVEEKIRTSSSDEVVIFENIDQEKLLVLEVRMKDGKLGSFRLEANWVRNYPEASLLSQVIGYTGKVDLEEIKSLANYMATDYVGKMGLEKTYESILRGTQGVLRYEKNALGETLSQETITEPEAGKSLVLWLDYELQEKAREELETVLKNVGSKKGTVIAMDPKTGGVLAMVSVPSFDNNVFSKGVDSEEIVALLKDPSQPLFNRAISGTYPSGSTIKPFVATAALEEKTVSPNKWFDDPGYISVPNPWDPSNPSKFMDWAVHGSVDMRTAIAVSCNVYFYTIGGGYGNQEGLGPVRIKKYLELFGWGKETGIDLFGEKPGFIPDPDWKKDYFEDEFDKIWRDGDTYNMSIGQGYLLVTPIQVATAFSAIANNGTLLKPKLVKEIINGSFDDGTVTEKIESEIIRENFVSEDNLQIVREGMRQGVTSGSSVTLNSLPVKAAAKTGTAQTSRENYYHNWVSVFAPYNDPEIVVTVIIEDVKGLQAAALPVAKGILGWYFSK